MEDKCRELGVRAVLSEVWAKGGEGGKALAEEVVRLCEQPCSEEFTFSYPTDTTLVNKLNAIVQRVYGGAKAVLTPAAQKQAERLTELGFGDLPVCMAKTQYSLSDDPTLLGAPKDFAVTVRSLKVSAGGLHRCPDGRDHDHAGSAQGPRCRKDRRGRKRQDHRSVLSCRITAYEKRPRSNDRGLCAFADIKIRSKPCSLLRVVGVARLELAASWSRTMRATICATPRCSFFIIMICSTLVKQNLTFRGEIFVDSCFRNFCIFLLFFLLTAAAPDPILKMLRSALSCKLC